MRTVFGNYTAAQTSYEEALTIVRAVHDPYWKSRLYISYGQLQRLRGDPMAAHTACVHASELAQKHRLPVQEQWALIELGHILTELLDYTAASSCYQQAIDSEQQAQWLYRTVDAYAGLATLLRIQGQVTDAIIHAEAALAILDQRGLTTTSKPFAIYGRCINILSDSRDPRTLDVLRRAHQQLQEIAQKIADKALRRSFLENVAVNRMLINMAQSEGIT